MVCSTWPASSGRGDHEATMTYIDQALLNAVEWGCRRFQVLTGRTNVWLALQLTNLSIVIYFAGVGVYLLTSNIWPRIGLSLFCAGLLYVLTQTVFKVLIETYEAYAYRRVAKGLRNPRRLRDIPLRIAFLTMALVLIYPLVLIYLNQGVPLVLLLSYSLIVLTTVILYLLACDPLPPCEGTVRQWLQGSDRSQVAVPVRERRPNSPTS